MICPEHRSKVKKNAVLRDLVPSESRISQANTLHVTTLDDLRADVQTFLELPEFP